MATIINNPPTNRVDRVDREVVDRTNSGVGWVLGLIVILAAVLLLLYYGIPALRSASHSATVNVPDHINVDVNGGSGSGTGTTSGSTGTTAK